VGAKTDLHSGVYGGAAPNPLFALVEIISKLKDSKGKVLIPGFYKNVKAPSKDELKAWKRLPFNEEKYRKAEVGSKVLTGEPDIRCCTGPGRVLRLRYMGCRAGLWRWERRR